MYETVALEGAWPCSSDAITGPLIAVVPSSHIATVLGASAPSWDRGRQSTVCRALGGGLIDTEHHVDWSRWTASITPSGTLNNPTSVRPHVRCASGIAHEA